ncbi:hypothetical protein TWF569_001416 [Orbilia oligospora]|uniref:Uncharacterized protein n=1 Tax=Orbilia oligospora TaxID=2813651 RepID=A0A7C8IZA0_ORBOL|nr:hypothetical protein TWF102_000553 [Orbilia oligospora]KAF3091814.1 hypothetical protein TWF706_009486 [Orbilia oligospora]KAF3091815.1 hypothetical protein TWF706_009486 [Orbilia oligospora]KAF3117457.1 hypothetical protein TWF103_006198 [Orbilia oligospora]KAF3117458.1 hypothetical protein TWF103_006198 [Orbilia oligospora]
MGRAKFATVEILTELESTILQDDILVSSQVNKAKEKCWQPLVNFDILEAGPGLAKQEKVMIARKKKTKTTSFHIARPNSTTTKLSAPGYIKATLGLTLVTTILPRILNMVRQG